ncbi:pTP protein [Bovine adenovirus 2]|uniref:Preterminal protein n=1 Tax=Bovine adenovirus 2 TaxID=114429 RepID=A0A9W4C9Z0_ADEB2|nr:pTP protein [Bovine adenovirus 2]
MSVNAIDCARLTGQSIYTIEVFRPVRNIWNRAQEWARAAITPAGLGWMSKYIYQYHRLMLMNLSPREPATHNWPLYNYPPPHILVGYQKLLQICNDYIFDVRAYSRLKYSEQINFGSQLMNWSVMANCSYTINTGAYHRFIDMDNFSDTLTSIQQAILAERIVADLALIRPMRGFGRTNLDADHDVPVEYLLQEQSKDIGACQERAWGLADRIRVQNAGRKDLVILTTIRKLKTAYFNFLLAKYLPLAPEQELSLPCDCFWLDAFIQKFAESDQAAEINEALRLQQVPTQTLTKCIISALSLPNCAGTALMGGAFTLRPREGNRAVTESMRRARGEMIEQFVDRLPMRRRRRREVPQPQVAAEEYTSELEELSFESEVRTAVAETIRLLEEELTVSARNQQFFNFAVNFYEVIQRLEALGDINETTLQRWVMYFFVAEHIATTLNYLNHQIRVSSPFGRYVMLNLAQVVMRARNEDGQIVYSRVWNENGEQAFSNIMSRISIDLAATVERAGRGELEQEEIEQFMAEIAYHDNSGDVSEILKQVAVNDADIDSMEISFRFRVTGPVVFSGLREIQNINRRVIRAATLFRQERRPLPALNERVQLPPAQE